MFTTTEAHIPLVCGQQTNNSLNQTHYRKLEKLPVCKHMFAVPTNHLLVQAHKHTDARGRKSRPTALMHSHTQGAVDSPVTATALQQGECCSQRETLSHTGRAQGHLVHRFHRKTTPNSNKSPETRLGGQGVCDSNS